MNTNTNTAPDLQTVAEFLMGHGPLDGYYFGEKPKGAGNYWWRNHLRAALAAAPKATKPEPVQPERVPLTDRQIADAYFEALGSQHLREQDRKMVTRFARAIEVAHGIQPAHKDQP